MPLVLTQHAQEASGDVNRYLDKEWVIYHFPRQYLKVVNYPIQEFGDRRFIYHRPTRGNAPSGYFGHGYISDPYEDKRTPNHFWIDILDARPMRLVPLRDEFGDYYETGTAATPNLRGRSIRFISPDVYHRILAAGKAFSMAPQHLAVQDTGVYAPAAAPKDAFRPMLEVPVGTGYLPRGNEPPDPYEAAALHERARDDHQATLDLVAKAVHRLGGTCLYNNNVDLFAMVGDRRFLIEAKSVTRPEVAVNRMRYGIGQLLDYSVRYRAELQNAEPVLAFGSPVARDVSWISTILQENRIAFVARKGGSISGANDLGDALPFTV